MIEAGLFSLLSNTPAIAALVGTRIYPVVLPTAPTLPALSYQIVGAMSKPTLNNSGFQRFRMQFDCWGQDYSDAVTLREALVKALNGYQGLLSDGTMLQNAQFIQPIDFFEHEALQYRCAVEFYLYFDFNS